jgi:hypothetical protein
MGTTIDEGALVRLAVGEFTVTGEVSSVGEDTVTVGGMTVPLDEVDAVTVLDWHGDGW